MKFAIIGLGNLGKALAANLTYIGHEVVGIDNDMQKLDSMKQQIASVIAVDCTDPDALQSLSLDKYDGVFVTFSKAFGVSVQTVALLKSLGVSKLIVRSMSEIHETVLKSIGVEQIITPEKDFAVAYALKILTHGMFQEKYDIGEKHSVITMNVPKSMVGEKIGKAGFESTFKLNLLCVRRPTRTKNILGIQVVEYQVVVFTDDNVVLQETDQLVLFGFTDHLKTFRSL